MKLKYIDISKDNQNYIQKLMVDSYDDDSLLHTGTDYFIDDGTEYFNEIIKYHFKVVMNGEKIIGGYSLDSLNKEIVCLFIDPLIQGFGFGKCVLDHIKEEYLFDLRVKIPSYSKKSYDFFKHNGFYVIKEDYYDDNILLEYKNIKGEENE